MRILIATDAWHPQINGVVRTLTMMAETAKAANVDISFLTPHSFRTFPMPGYPGLRLALPYAAKVRRIIDAVKPDSIHIATEGPIGLAMRRYCQKTDFPLRQVFIPVFRNMYQRVCRYRNRGYGRRCGGFTARAMLSWRLHPRWYRNCAGETFKMSYYGLAGSISTCSTRAIPVYIWPARFFSL